MTDKIKLSGPPDLDSKHTINQVFIFQDPLDNISLSKREIENIFLPVTEKITLKLLQKHKTLTLSLDNSNLGTNMKQNL